MITIRVGRDIRSGSVVDLTEDTAFTLSLLEKTWAWRQRLVEEVALGDAQHARVESAFQIEFPPDLIAQFDVGPAASRAKVILPMTTRPKRPLIGFEAAGPGGGPALLHRRSATAEVQAEYLERLLEQHGTPALQAVLDTATLQAICLFTPGPIRVGDRTVPVESAAATYLSHLLGLEIPRVEVPALFERTRRAADRLCALLDEEPDPFSAAERFVLGLAALAVLTQGRARPGDLDELHAVLEAYDAAVASAGGAAEPFLEALAEYGRRWEVLLEVEVPLSEPCTIKLSEDRPLELSWRNHSVQPFNFADAESDHVQVRVADQSVRLAGYEVRPRERGTAPVLLDSRAEIAPGFDGVRATDESLALYSADPDRPYHLDVTLRLRPAPLSWWAGLTILLLTIIAIPIAVTTPDNRDQVDALALLSTPTTFAVAVLLVREQTPLAARLQRHLRRLLVVALAALWTAVLVKLGTGR